jgi:diguanylate cyclase (GGDEF)-like protein
MLLLQDVDENEAKQIAERIRRAVQDAKPVEANTVTTVTATIGIAHVKTPPESLSHLIERVDNAMYDGKRQGRNRIILA